MSTPGLKKLVGAKWNKNMGHYWTYVSSQLLQTQMEQDERMLPVWGDHKYCISDTEWDECEIDISYNYTIIKMVFQICSIATLHFFIYALNVRFAICTKVTDIALS